MDTKKELAVVEKLNSSVFKVIGNDKLIGFQKAFMISEAIKELKVLLTNEYMAPIMELQGNRLGFKSDKDKEGGYPLEVVKNCLIEAVLTGVQPHGNQFNIIAGNCYVTKEGFGYLLNNVAGLNYTIIPMLPNINAEGTSASIVMNIRWTINGFTKEENIEIPIKVNKFMGADAVIGKATRKARAWLFNNINVTEIADGDITEDISYKEVKKEENKIVLEDLVALFELKKENLSDKEYKAAKDVLEIMDETRYAKLQTLLMAK